MARGDVDQNGNPIDQPDTGTPDPSQPANRATRQQVIDWYTNLLGRAPESEDIINGYVNNPGGPDAVYAAIASSPEAKAYNTKWQAANPQNAPAAPPAAAPPAGGGGGAPPSTQFPAWDKPWTPPAWDPTPNAPTFKPPEFKAPPPFSFGDFKAPTAQDALSDPGYQFRVQQGQDVLQHSAAARGVLNTGMTLKDILDYGQNSASQEYQNVFNRQANTYGMNRGNAVDTYNTNYATQYVDPYKYAYQGALDTFNPSFDAWKTNAAATERKNEFATNNSMKYWEDQYNQFLNEQRDRWGRARDVLTA